jgi:hypothetical protein
MHNNVADVKTHGLCLFIPIGFFHAKRLSPKPSPVFHPKMHENVKNSEKVGKSIYGSPTLLTIVKGGWST